MIGKRKKRFAISRATNDIVRIFSGEISESEEKKILERKSESAEYRNALSSNREILAEVEALADDPELLMLVDKYREPKHSTTIIDRKIKSYWPKIAIAAGIVLAITLGFLIVPSAIQPNNNIERYVTRVGEQKTITLIDGSVITLNTATELFVDMKGSTRRIIMERGEAYYDVAENPDKPFTVVLGERSVTVLGTEFNIRKLPEKFTLTVTEGIVSVHRSNEILVETAPVLTVDKEKESISFDKQRKVTKGTIVEFDSDKKDFVAYRPKNIEHNQSWRKGLVVFINQPLYKVIHEFNRYSTKKILIEDSAIMNIPVRASVRVNQPGSALIGLENSLPIKINSYFDRIILTAK